ncbi:hypothetical protein ACGF0D_10790 [Kitasatospora sp. NPDC048298]|uniref:hypothetical protein n=1 Tax=Kitasatospora sp. NPDC048298 TaxID=3364049 RepID=UPI003711FA5C
MPSIAPLISAWQRRLGSQAGPLGPAPSAGSGDTPNGLPVQVELLVDGTWTDITEYVMVRNGSGAIRITRGQPNEGAHTEPGMCSFQLNNRDGRFSPRNPLSPLYGKIGRNTRLRVSVPLGDRKVIRSAGVEVVAWPQSWDSTGADVWVDMQAAGPLRRLGQGQTPLRSVLYRAMTSATVPVPPVAYWPCEDQREATTIASGLNAGIPMVVTGRPNLAASSMFVASDSLPTMTAGASLTGAIPAYTDSGAAQVRFLLGVPSAGFASGAVVCRFTTTGTAAAWELYADTTSGSIGLRAFDSPGNLIHDTGLIIFAINSAPFLCSIQLSQNGNNIDTSIVLWKLGAPAADFWNSTLASRTVGVVQTVTISPTGALTDGAVGHISVQPQLTSIFDMGAQLSAYAGESAGARITRLGAEEGIFTSSAGATPAMGPQRPASFLALIQECVDADMGTLYETGGGVSYRSTSFNGNQPPNVVLSYTACNLSEVPKPVDDDTYTRNDITVSRVNGSSARATLDTGALSTKSPPMGAGRYTESVQVNVQSDAQLADQAGWRLHLGTVDEPRYPVIAVNLAHPSITPSLRAQILALDIGWRMTMTDLPPWLPPGAASQIILGISETITGFEHRITFNCAPESPYQVALLDDPVRCGLDTGGSTLAMDVGNTDTTFQVATTTGPLWSTSVSDVPFDADIGGEVVTVTNISGAVSPQTFAVLRSVNGIVKGQPTGALIRMHQPATIAFL